jgi:GNAT superfamily N-acetyltransferase
VALGQLGARFFEHALQRLGVEGLREPKHEVLEAYPLPLMIGNLSPQAVDARTASREFWTRYHAYRRIRHAESHPGDPPKPDDLVEIAMKHENPFELQYRFEISRDGQMISDFFAAAARPGAPGYESNKPFMWVAASVHPDHRRRGIGRSWIPLILQLMARHGCTTLTMDTHEESGHQFLKWMGAEGKSAGAENRLELADVDWAMLRTWVEDGAARSSSTRLEVYDGHLPEAMWDEYCPQFAALLNTMPWDDLDHGEITVTRAELADWYQQLDEQGGTDYTMLTREPDGTISGITDMNFAPYWPQVIDQGFTGVRADARGRGLGKWLKAGMLLHVRNIYPDLKTVITGNAASNDPMLAINKKMGFKEHRAGNEYQITLEKLRAGPAGD